MYYSREGTVSVAGLGEVRLLQLANHNEWFVLYIVRN